MKYKLISAVLALALLGAVCGWCECYSDFIRSDEEREIYEDRAANWEDEYAQLAADLESIEEQLAATEMEQLELIQGVQAIPQGEMLITCYDTDCSICETGHVTCSGMKAITGVTVAADLSVYPLGTILYIEGVGLRTVTDTGGGIHGQQLDLLVEDAHGEEAKSIYGYRKVWVLE